MSHPTATINGCSLEDCHTNLFALTDLAGIRWRKYTGESSYCTEPLDDHVLASFTRCIQADILCVWRRGQKTGAGDRGGAVDQLACKKELWIFWYGDEPMSLGTLVSPDLQIDHNDEGSWEAEGMPYECRTLLFKALHNLIERCLLQQNFVRIGKWFVQPFDQRHLHDKGAHLSIEFSFFLHGESTVCASIDVRQHPPLWRLHTYHLNLATQAGQAGLPVILAPYGLAGTLTGQAYKDTDLTTQKVLSIWQEFYVLTDHADMAPDAARCSKVVEVVVGGARMRYPSSFILVADDTQQEIIRQHGGTIPQPSPLPATTTPPSSPRVPQHSQGEPTIKLMPGAAYVDNTYQAAVTLEGGHELSSRFVEKVWMDCAITSGVTANSRHQQSDLSTMEMEATTLGSWDCGDPGQKNPCGCSMHKGSKRSGSGSQNKGGPSPSKHSKDKDKDKDGKRSSSSSSRGAQPFHRRGLGGSEAFLHHEMDYLMQTIPAKAVGCIRPVMGGQQQGVGSMRGSNQQPPTPGGPASSGATTGTSASTTPAGSNPQQQPASIDGGQNNLSVGPSGPADSPHSAAPSPLVASQPPSQPPVSSAVTHNGTSTSDPTMPTLSPHPPSKHDKDASGTASFPGASQKPAGAEDTTQTTMNGNLAPHQQQQLMNGHLSPEQAARLSAGQLPIKQEAPANPYRTNATPAEVCVKTEPVNSWLESMNAAKGGVGVTGATAGTTIKRPALPTKQYEENDEELAVHNLYNFDHLNAWLEHPVKRQKVDEEGGISPLVPSRRRGKPSPSGPAHDPYEFSDELSSSPTLSHRRASYRGREEGGKDGISIKEEKPDTPGGPGDGTEGPALGVAGSAAAGFSMGFSERELVPSIQDLDNMFDSDSESNDAGLDPFQVPTPPPSKDGIKDGILGDSKLLLGGIGNKQNVHGQTTLTGGAVSRLEQGPNHTDLHRMFPTPPSHEGIHSELSPCNGPDGATDLTAMDQSATKSALAAGEYPFKRLTGEDSVKDWSYVYKPPLVTNFVSSSKYSPIELPSSRLSPLTIAVPEYHPTWQSAFPLPIIDKQPQTQTSSHYTNVPSVEPRTPGSAQRGTGAPASVPDRSAASPAASFQRDGAANTSSGPSSQQQRTPRTPMSYELQSPASNASSYLNKNVNSVGGPTTNCTLAEVHSLVVNIMLSDSLVNLFKDHNYDSCTICVCNNNIKGADVGLYVADRTGEDQYPCQCGFSAVMSRKYGVNAGLFYEDEVDITGIRDDRLEHRKPSLLAIQPPPTDSAEGGDGDKDKEGISGTGNASGEQMPQELLLLLAGQFSSLYPSLAIQFNCGKVHPALEGIETHDAVNMLEVQDGCEACYTALEVGRQAMDNCASAKLEDPVMKSTCIHKWPYLQSTAKIPANSQDVVRLLKSLQPLLQDAIQKKRTMRKWDHVYTITGPLSWKDFHLLAGRGSDETSEPQPIPPLLVGHDKDWMKLSPHSLRYWDKLLVEPYGQQQDVAYVVVAPDSDHILTHIKAFMADLSRQYELCRLGKHRPVSTKLRDSILRVGKKEAKSLSETQVDDWFNLIGDSPLAAKLRLYARVCRNTLAPFINRAVVDDVSHLRSIFTDTSYRAPAHHTRPQHPADRPSGYHPTSGEPSPAPAPHTPDSSTDYDRDNEPQTTQGRYNAGLADEADTSLPTIVVYLIDPFTYSQDWEHVNRMATLGLLRCYQEILKNLHHSLSVHVQLQIIPLQTLLKYRETENGQILKNVSLAVYTQCRRFVSQTVAGKSMTGFGPAAAGLDIIKKHGNENARLPSLRLYTPPYVICPVKENKVSISNGPAMENSRVLLCAYCLSEDQRWLLGVCTDQKGELMETVTINVDIPNRNRRKKASARRIGLAKLWDFIMSVMSMTTTPWRLVIGRFGRIGHGELQGWAGLLSSKNLGKCNKQLRETCGQCQVIGANDPSPVILSACLVSMETHSTIHIMPDSVKMEEEKLSSKIQMDTPRDASCTHILVVPTSSRAQANQAAGGPGGEVDPHTVDTADDEDDLMNMLGMSGMGQGDDMPDMDIGLNDIGDIGDMLGGLMDTETVGVNNLDQQVGTTSPTGLGPGGGTHSALSNGPKQHSSSSEEAQDGTHNLLQQPLAMGFYMSTARTGPTPKWFWSNCPHRENLCPTCLKAALHVNSRPQDDGGSHLPKANHPLDSSFTCDVLRYVLETYNALSWLTMDPLSNDRRSCLPAHFVVLMQLYHTFNRFV